MNININPFALTAAGLLLFILIVLHFTRRSYQRSQRSRSRSRRRKRTRRVLERPPLLDVYVEKLDAELRGWDWRGFKPLALKFIPTSPPSPPPSSPPPNPDAAPLAPSTPARRFTFSSLWAPSSPTPPSPQLPSHPHTLPLHTGHIMTSRNDITQPTTMDLEKDPELGLSVDTSSPPASGELEIAVAILMPTPYFYGRRKSVYSSDSSEDWEKEEDEGEELDFVLGLTSVPWNEKWYDDTEEAV